MGTGCPPECLCTPSKSPPPRPSVCCLASALGSVQCWSTTASLSSSTHLLLATIASTESFSCELSCDLFEDAIDPMTQVRRLVVSSECASCDLHLDHGEDWQW